MYTKKLKRRGKPRGGASQPPPPPPPSFFFGGPPADDDDGRRDFRGTTSSCVLWGVDYGPPPPLDETVQQWARRLRIPTDDIERYNYFDRARQRTEAHVRNLPLHTHHLLRSYNAYGVFKNPLCELPPHLRKRLLDPDSDSFLGLRPDGSKRWTTYPPPEGTILGTVHDAGFGRKPQPIAYGRPRPRDDEDKNRGAEEDPYQDQRVPLPPERGGPPVVPPPAPAPARERGGPPVVPPSLESKNSTDLGGGRKTKRKLTYKKKYQKKRRKTGRKKRRKTGKRN